jgi:TIR domain
MPDVFISYSAKDEELAHFVKSHLVAQGLSVFLASIALAPGERWTPRIIDELRASEWVCLLASKNALASANVQLELGGAIFGKKKLVPIMWDVQPSELPRWVSDFQGLILTGATLENINLQVAQLAANIKESKVKGQLVAGAVFAGILWLLRKG